MSFFDDFTKTVSDATHTVTKKGKKLADITKLNFSIVDEQRKVDFYYANIGKLYVDTLGEGAEGKMAELISELKATEEKIAQYRKELNTLKGVKVCPHCEEEVPEEAKFCNNCGNSL